MSNIEEMEKLLYKLWEVIKKRPILHIEDKLFYDLATKFLNQHKDHIDRMARLEKQIAELIEPEENLKVGGTD